MNIWIISASVTTSLLAFLFALRSARKLSDMDRHMDNMASQLKQQNFAFEEAKAALQELRNEVYGNTTLPYTDADRNATDPQVPIFIEQAESLRNTAQIMQDAAEPSTFDDPKTWDDV